MRSRTVLVLLLLLAAPAAALIEVSNGTADETTSFRGFDAPATALGDFDGDGRPELVGHNENRVLYVLATDRPDVLAEIRPPYPAGWGARPITSPVVADVDQDGALDIVVTTSAATTCLYSFTGRSGPSQFGFVQSWCRRADAYDGGGASADGTPWVEDVTGDGKAEVFVQTETRGLFAYRHDGSLMWSRNEWGGNAGPTVSDLDGDGVKEAIFFSDGGTVRALDARTGGARWTFSARGFVHPAAIPVSGAAGDLDGDGKKEVVFFAREAVHTADYTRNHLGIFVLRSDGSLRWWRHPGWANPLSYTHPVLIDVNGDGRKEILGADWNTIGRNPGAWERLGPSNVFLYDRHGNLLWRFVGNNVWSNDDVPVADVDGDGDLDVFALSHEGTDGITFLDLRTGARTGRWNTPGWTTLRAPVVGDLLGDGKLGWALPVIRGGAGGYLIETRGAACKVAYGGWQVRTPCDPVSGSDGGDPTPPGGLEATFRHPRGNNWWVEVDVEANHALSAVDARVDGGSWIGLTRQSWGSWARSFRVETGSIVEFRARSGAETALSGGYLWPDGTPGGGGAEFEATFRNVRGNRWWVEVDVTASAPLAGVDARVNGGSWTPLDKKAGAPGRRASRSPPARRWTSGRAPAGGPSTSPRRTPGPPDPASRFGGLVGRNAMTARPRCPRVPRATLAVQRADKDLFTRLTLELQVALGRPLTAGEAFALVVGYAAGDTAGFLEWAARQGDWGLAGQES